MSKDDFQYGKNVGEPAVTVVHAELQRSDESIYRSKCPVCKKGVLCVLREQAPPFQLRENDRCIACAQRVIYADIVDMRKKLG